MNTGRWPTRQAGMVVLAWGLSAILAACGGGGGGGASPQAQSDASPQNVANWQSMRVQSVVQPLAPGNTDQPIGGNAPYALWVAQQADGSNHLVRGAAGTDARGVSTTVLMTGLPSQALSNTTIAVHAGDWALAVWEADNASEPASKRLLARLAGPGTDSGVILLSEHFQGPVSDVRAAIDPSGNNVLVWDEPGHLGAQGRVVQGNLLRGADLGASLARVQSLLVGPDGQGWLFQELLRNDASLQEVRRITAAAGVGSPVRLDVTTGGPLYVPPGRLTAPLVSSADGPDSFTAVSMQQQPGAAGPCLVVRRLVNGRLQTPACVSVSGNSLPNGKQVSLSSHPNGAAVLVWSVGDSWRDLALYESRRATASGPWSTPALLTRLPVDSTFSLLHELKTGMSANGQAVVVYVASEVLGGLHEARAMTRPLTGRWEGPTDLSLPGFSRQALQLAFNGQGMPGILQALSAGQEAAVQLSTWSAEGWRSATLKSGFQLAYTPPGYANVRLHLAAQGASGWLAAWLEGEGPSRQGVPGTFWLTEYR